MKHGLLQEKLSAISVESDVITILINGDKKHSKRWKLNSTKWHYRYLPSEKAPKYCEWIFTWKNHWDKFQLPVQLKDTNDLFGWFTGLDKAEIRLRASLQDDDVLFGLVFTPNTKAIGKYHDDIAYDKALDLIKDHLAFTNL